MNTEYTKKENYIKRCIEEGKNYYSSYQMQVLKSKFYTAITFNKDDIEYKKRIDELLKYAKETLDKNIEKLKRKQKKIEDDKIKRLKEEKIHNYIIEKEKNTNERVIAFKDRTPLPPKVKKNDKDFKIINSIYDVREKLLTTNDIYSLFGEDYLDMELYIKTMIDHSILNFVAYSQTNDESLSAFSKQSYNTKFPKYVEARQELFNFLSQEIQKPGINIHEFLSNILSNETLLRQFMYEVNPMYLDKTSEDYNTIKNEINKQKKKNNPSLKVLNLVQNAVSNMNLNAEMINSLIKRNETKTKTL